MRRSGLFFLAALLWAGVAVGTAVAAEDAAYCEVVSVTGDVQLLRKGQPAAGLAQGMALAQGDNLVVGKGASADIAFDPAWENTARLNSDTRVTLRSLKPVKLNMVSGDVYSKLDRLPQGQPFEVKTPTSVAVVRGTKFRVTHLNGFSTVFNDSETSLVYVYHLDENGNRAGRAIVLQPGESITIAGEAEAFDSPLDELEDERDREDQQQLNEELSRERFEQPDDDPRDNNFQNF